MRHRKAGLKLNRTPSHRNAMFRNMVTSLFKYERIRTTGAKAKELRRWADHVITLAKRGDLHARRQALAIVREKEVVHKLFEQAPERFGTTSGGYTRIIKLGRRPGDAAPVSLIELVYSDDTKKKKGKKKKAKTVRTAQKPAADKAVAADKQVKQPAKTKAASLEEKEDSKVETKTSEKKTAAKPKPAASKKTATAKKEDKTDTKKKKPSEEKSDKSLKADTPKSDSKPAAKKKSASAEKESKPDAEKKKASTTKTTEDEK